MTFNDYQVTERAPRQERLELDAPRRKEGTPFEMLFKQEYSATGNTWSVGVVRHYGKTTVTIYSPVLRREYVRFTRLYFDNPLAIVGFVKSMINAHIALGYKLSMTGKDTADLYHELRRVF